MPRFRAVVLASLMALMPSAVAAQTQFTIGAFGGLYDATNDMYDQLLPGFLLRFGQEIGWTIGGRMAIWPAPRFGIELQGAYVGSNGRIRIADFTDPNDIFVFDESLGGNIVMGSASLLYAIIKPQLEPLMVFVSGGVGIVSRSGDWVDFLDALFANDNPPRSFNQTTDIAGVLGIGLKYTVARGVNVRGDVQDYVSSFKDDDLAGDARIQNDLLITLGIEAFFGG